VNAFFLNALECLARIFETVGRSGDARTVRVQRERTFTAFQRVFFNNDLGLYVDGEGARHASIHANLFPLAFGLVPSDRIRKVADFVVSRGMACSVYAAQFLVDGLYRAGRGDAGSALLVSRGERSWAHMVNDVGTTIALEAWDDRFKPNQDWNHAWGAAPANLIPRRVVGVEIAAPGARSVRVAPFPAHLTRFDALVPTIRGGVRVRYERDGNDDRYEVCLPPNCDGVFVPKERPGVRIASVWVDNRRLPADRPSLESTLLPGVVHRIVVRYAPA
ncbi:MAG: alpha-L-rhamnosidase C-terminal domain-containing protein, partial [Armatimonadaceae bacterium]